MQTGVWLVSRELTEAAGSWDTRLLADDDGEYFCRVLMASDGTRFVPDAKVFYRVSGPNRLSFVGQSDRKLEAHLLSIKLHIGYLRSLEDSERTRAACMEYLRTLLPYFHPERPDLVKEMEQQAAALGGKLETPRLSWKYAWIDKVFGRAVAKRTQLQYNQLKEALIARWDKTLFQFEKRNHPGNPCGS